MVILRKDSIRFQSSLVRPDYESCHDYTGDNCICWKWEDMKAQAKAEGVHWGVIRHRELMNNPYMKRWMNSKK